MTGRLRVVADPDLEQARIARIVAEAEALVDKLFGPGGHEACGYRKASIGIAWRLRDAVYGTHQGET